MRYAFYNKPAGVVIYFVTPGRPCCPSIPRQLDIARPPVIRLSLADKSINNSCRGSISWPLSPRSSLAIVPFLNRNLDQNHTAREVKVITISRRHSRTAHFLSYDISNCPSLR